VRSVQLIYHVKNYEGYSKDYEFSRAGMAEHWRAGYHDARRTLRHREVLLRPSNHEGILLSILLLTDASRSGISASE
jgi:NTE family protein